ncbi:hypothetical protein WJX77_008292 [Trebouxia sp. C0004]
MLSRLCRVPERFCKLTTSAGVNPASRRWPVFLDSRQQHGIWPEEEGRQTRKRRRDKADFGDAGNDSLGFAPEELDLTHLDQTQGTPAAPPASAINHENSQPEHQAHAQQLTHLDSQGRAQMVDVGQKKATARAATASAIVHLNNAAFSAIASGRKSAKGDALTVAQLAGIMGAKQTAQLIPLCHNIPLDKVSVELSLDSCERSVHIEASAKTQGHTGVEMEAMVAASVAALTVYDMCKALDKGITIEHVRLEAKTGGKSGNYHRLSIP